LAGLNAGARRAAVAAFLLSVSLLHIEWSMRTDLYALASALALFSTTAFFELPREGEFSWTYTAWAVLLIYSSPYAAPLAVLHLMALGFLPAGCRRRAAGAMIAAWTAAFACFVPWLVFAGSRAAGMLGSDFTGSHPGLQSLREFLVRVPLFFAQGGEVTRDLWHWGAPLPGLLAALYFGCYLISAIRAAKGSGDSALRLAHIAVPWGVASVAILDAASGNYYSHRQLLWVLPFYLIGAADGFLWLVDRPAARFSRFPKPAGLVLGAAAVLLLIASHGLYRRTVEAQIALGRGLQGVLQELDSRLRPGDVLVFENARLAQEFLYHYDREAFRSGPVYLDLPRAMRVERGGRENELRIDAEGGAKDRASDAEPLKTWYFQGTMHDMSVRVPPGRG